MIRGSWIQRAVWLGLAGFAMGFLVPGRADEPADQTSRLLEFQKIARGEVEAVRFRAEGSSSPFVLHPEPILKWTNPTVGDISGGLYLWTAGGRPEVVASIFLWYGRTLPKSGILRDELTDEFQSLSLGGFAMERAGAKVWTCSQPGVELRRIPEAPVPAGTPAQQLRQMRALAEKFTASQTNHKGESRPARLLTQPVYRYGGTASEPSDGALFLFVDATDPQVILLLESRLVQGQPRWHYALARMTHERLQVHYRGEEVWTLPLLTPDEETDRRAPYTKFFFDLKELAEAPKRR
jgi:hypothetical protein